MHAVHLYLVKYEGYELPHCAETWWDNYAAIIYGYGTAFPCLLYLETTDHSTTIRNEPLVELTNAKCKAFPSRFKGYRVLSESHTKNLINHRFREVSGKVVLNVACLETLAEQPGKNPRVGFGQAEELEISWNVGTQWKLGDVLVQTIWPFCWSHQQFGSSARGLLNRPLLAPPQILADGSIPFAASCASWYKFLPFSMWSWASAKWCLQASRKASIGTCSSLVSVDCWCLPRNRGERKNCCRCPSDNSHWWPQWVNLVNLHWLTQYYLIISNQPGKSCRCGVISLRPELRLRSNQSRKMNGV